jgi:hypothetical protein
MMPVNNEYEEWKTDPVAQQEYTEYLIKEALSKDPDPNKYFIQFTRNFNQIFKEKT